MDSPYRTMAELREIVAQAAKEKATFAKRFPEIVIGAKVTLKEGESECYDYRVVGSHPFKTGMFGVVGAVAVPKLYEPKVLPANWLPYFLCVDYLDENDHMQRCKAEYTEVEVVKDEAG